MDGEQSGSGRGSTAFSGFGDHSGGLAVEAGAIGRQALAVGEAVAVAAAGAVAVAASAAVVSAVVVVRRWSEIASATREPLLMHRKLSGQR